MTPKALWAWIGVIGLVLIILGGFLAIIPFIGLPMMGVGTVLFLVAVIVLIPILIREKRQDDKEMRSEISERELRP
jgi:Ni,Fe-hydrogenase I cytochrome b subunit